MDIEKAWKNQDDPVDNKLYSIEHLEPQKRMRVWVTQQMYDVLEALKPSNYLTEFVRFMKGCANLSRCYPNHEDLGHIDEIRMEFWSRYQYVVKTRIKPMIKRIRLMQVRRDLIKMRMYGNV